MQVFVEQTSELKRKMKVQVPEDRIQSECAKRIDSLARTIKLDGFRPGKVPVGLIRKRFGKSVRNEVVGELMRSALLDALNEHDLRPAGVPFIENTTDEAGKGLEFDAVFEIYPSVEVGAYAGLQIVRPVCEISEADIDAMIEKLRGQRRKWQLVERAANDGDQATISFSGKIEEENFTDGTVDDQVVEIGSQQMIPGFEDNLIGMSAGEGKTFTLTFPSEYRNQKFAGKSAEFSVTIKKVEEPVLPEVDEEFIKQFGVESADLAEFRDSLKEQMEKEKNKTIRSRTKTAVIDAMLAANSITLPDVMVDQEIEELKKQHAPHDRSEAEITEEQLGFYESQAKRRVKLGLLWAEIIARNNLTADAARVRATVEELAQSFNSPDAVVDWYYSNPEQLQNIERMVLEDQVVDLVLAGASVIDEPVEFASLAASD